MIGGMLAGADSIDDLDRLALEEFGLFDYEHPAEASAGLATDLEALRSQIRQTNKIGNAITATSNFTFNNSTAKGRTFVNQMSRIMLRAYNAEAENAVKTVKAGNLASAQKSTAARSSSRLTHATVAPTPRGVLGSPSR